MQFTTRKRRQTPTVIIVSLIDVLIVVLIFLMVSTTFKKQPALKLALAQSSQAKAGASTQGKHFIVTIPKSGPLYIDTDPVTMETLQKRLAEAVKVNPDLSLTINADTDAPWGLVVKVRDAIAKAGVQNVSASVKSVKPE